MKDLTKFQAYLEEVLTKARDEHEATHDELVRVTNYALDAIKYPISAPVNITDKDAYEKAQKHPAKAQATEHKSAEHKK